VQRGDAHSGGSIAMDLSSLYFVAPKANMDASSPLASVANDVVDAATKGVSVASKDVDLGGKIVDERRVQVADTVQA
jgi:hypothetical protein